MKNIQPLNRQVEIKIGPLTEWEGGGSESAAVRIYGDGTNNNLRIKFSIAKHIVSTTTPTTISVYNLGPGIRGALQNSQAQIVVKAGWANVGLLSVFKGSLMTAISRRDGADVVTDMLCMAAIGATSRTIISKAFGPTYELSRMLIDIAKTFPSIDVDPKLIDVKDVFLGNQGYSYAGSVSDLLDKLSRVHGFSWWINDGRFYALDDNKTISEGNVVISASNGFLMRAEPVLSSPWQKQSGTSIDSLFNPYIMPGSSVVLETKINPSLNGAYKVHQMTHEGDTHEDSWSTSIINYKIQKEGEGV